MTKKFDENNVLGVDFKLYNSFEDAEIDSNEWKFCNYNDPGVGFPRDCGPVSAVIFQWNSLTRGGKNDVSYYVWAKNPTIGTRSNLPGSDWLMTYGKDMFEGLDLDSTLSIYQVIVPFRCNNHCVTFDSASTQWFSCQRYEKIFSLRSNLHPRRRK